MPSACSMPAPGGTGSGGTRSGGTRSGGTRSGGTTLRGRGSHGLERRFVAVDRLDQIALEAQGGVDLDFDLLSHVGMFVEERLRVAAPLAEPLLAIGEERPRLG